MLIFKLNFKYQLRNQKYRCMYVILKFQTMNSMLYRLHYTNNVKKFLFYCKM